LSQKSIVLSFARSLGLRVPASLRQLIGCLGISLRLKVGEGLASGRARIGSFVVERYISSLVDAQLGSLELGPDPSLHSLVLAFNSGKLNCIVVVLISAEVADRVFVEVFAVYLVSAAEGVERRVAGAVALEVVSALARVLRLFYDDSLVSIVVDASRRVVRELSGGGVGISLRFESVRVDGGQLQAHSVWSLGRKALLGKTEVGQFGIGLGQKVDELNAGGDVARFGVCVQRKSTLFANTDGQLWRSWGRSGNRVELSLHISLLARLVQWLVVLVHPGGELGLLGLLLCQCDCVAAFTRERVESAVGLEQSSV